MSSKIEIVVVGVGYVGLPQALAFGQKYLTIGYDYFSKRIEELQNGIDARKEVNSEEFALATQLSFTKTLKQSVQKRVYFITVPTPVDSLKRPDLSHLKAATSTIAQYLKKGDLVVYESTTYPGCTQELVQEVLLPKSGLKIGDIGVAYSPERMVPGKNQNPSHNKTRVLGADSLQTLEKVKALYESVGFQIHKVPSVEHAEMSKLVENTQRDLNISFVNEVAMLCDRFGLSTQDVLKAAGTKWNFHPYQPGMVGGHCISVDPYYLIQKAEAEGYFPKVIGAGREVNEQIPLFLASKFIKTAIQKGFKVSGEKCLVLGLTYKANCSDTRNSKVFKFIEELEAFGLQVISHDPYVRAIDYQLDNFSFVVKAVAHDAYEDLDFRKVKLLCDLTHTLPSEMVDCGF